MEITPEQAHTLIARLEQLNVPSVTPEVYHTMERLLDSARSADWNEGYAAGRRSAAS